MYGRRTKKRTASVAESTIKQLNKVKVGECFKFLNGRAEYCVLKHGVGKFLTRVEHSATKARYNIDSSTKVMAFPVVRFR